MRKSGARFPYPTGIRKAQALPRIKCHFGAELRSHMTLVKVLVEELGYKSSLKSCGNLGHTLTRLRPSIATPGAFQASQDLCLSIVFVSFNCLKILFPV